MTATEIIAKKRDGMKLSGEEIDFFIYGYATNQIPDYQMSALLMAIYLQGMAAGETADLTRAMLHSGDRIDLSHIPGPKIDKHSTGGVGDKVSLVLAPLLAAAGVTVPMISGRGLQHSGGTLDKLEAIPGFRTSLGVEEFCRLLEQIGFAMIGQTDRIVPADKKMYALRDTTGTVASIPLITSSILSKKLAEGIDGLVLDVKTGKGAFMQKYEDALALANSLVETARLNGLPALALITNMEQPLGYAVGNWLETREAIMTLKGNGPLDLVKLTLALGSYMLFMAGKVKAPTKGLKVLNKLLTNGKALEKFRELVVAQGGNDACLLDTSMLYNPKIKQQIRSQQSGFVSELDARKIGMASLAMGGGREVMEDTIDYGAGIVLNKKIGDPVNKGDLLAVLYTDREKSLPEVMKLVKDAFKLSPDKVDGPPLILKLVKSNTKP